MHVLVFCFSGRNLGTLFEVLCVGLSIMNMKLFDAYRIINQRILAVTLEYLGDIRVKEIFPRGNNKVIIYFLIS